MNELLELTRENNVMLKYIVQFINEVKLTSQSRDNEDFVRNVLANMLSNIPIGKCGNFVD